MKKIHITKKNMEKLPKPQKGYSEYADREEKALKVIITYAGTKAFYFRMKIRGQPYRFKIADFDESCRIEEIRDHAGELRRQIKSGSETIFGAKNRKEETLKALCSKYLADYAVREKLTWREDKKDFQSFLSPWFSRRISEVTRNDVQELHRQITRENGPYRANRILAKISSLYSKAQEWGWSEKNPACRIRRNKERQRDRFLNSGELARFFKALDEEKDSLFKSFIWIAILTGARRDNIRCMKWEQIDFDLKIWTIPRTKNGKALTVQLPEEAILILKGIPKTGSWVFPSTRSASGHVMDHRKTLNRILKKAGISDLHLHDLRRTLASWMAINGTSLHIIAGVLGHSSTRCTQIYARLDDHARRESVGAAVEKMLSFRASSVSEISK